MHRFAEIAFTPTVQALQERDGSRANYARLEKQGGPNAALTAREETLSAPDSGINDRFRN